MPNEMVCITHREPNKQKMSDNIDIVALHKKNVTKFLNVDYGNGFGFQLDGFHSECGLENMVIFERFAFASSADFGATMEQYKKDKKDWPDARIQQVLRETFNSSTIEVVDFLGRKFCAMHFLEWEKIPLIFQWFLDNGRFNARPHCVLDVAFHAGDRFSWAEVEKRYIAAFMEDVEYEKTTPAGRMGEAFRWGSVFRRCHKSALTKHYNWRTQEGKDFCTKLRRYLDKNAEASRVKAHFAWAGLDDACRHFAVAHRGVWSAYEPSMAVVGVPFLQAPIATVSVASSSPRPESPLRGTLLVAAQQAKPVEVEKKRKHEDEPEQEKVVVDVVADAQICMICLDVPANTMVLPCQHVVVCKSCSNNLRQTNDRRTCCYCRCPITFVLADGATDQVV